jgi:hypothetical protein
MNDGLRLRWSPLCWMIGENRFRTPLVLNFRQFSGILSPDIRTPLIHYLPLHFACSRAPSARSGFAVQPLLLETGAVNKGVKDE